MLQPFNTVPHVVVISPTLGLFLFLFPKPSLEAPKYAIIPLSSFRMATLPFVFTLSWANDGHAKQLTRMMCDKVFFHRYSVLLMLSICFLQIY